MKNISEQKTTHIDISDDILIIESSEILINLSLNMIKTCTLDECVFEISNETICCLSTTLVVKITHNTIIIDNPFIMRININTPLNILYEYYTKNREKHSARVKEFERQNIIKQEQNDLINKIKNDPLYKYIKLVNNIVKYYKKANKKIKRTPEEWKEYNISDEYYKLNELGFYTKYPKIITNITTLENAKDTFDNMKIYVKQIYETETKDSEWLQQHKNLELLNINLPDKTTWLYRYFGIHYIF